MWPVVESSAASADAFLCHVFGRAVRPVKEPERYPRGSAERGGYVRDAYSAPMAGEQFGGQNETKRMNPTLKNI